MKWKDVLLGAIASLAVTVIGGITVYYFTKGPDQKKTERLIYSVQQSGSFKGGNQNVAVAAVKVENDGGLAAKRVIVALNFKTAEIKDFALDVNAGTKEVAREVKPRSIQFTYETLLPKESLTVNLLLSSPEKPLVSVRSDANLGTEKSLEIAPNSRTARVNDFLELLVPLTGVLLGLAFVAMAIVLRRSRSVWDTSSTVKNNAGFILLHHGFVDEATAILISALRSGSYDGITLSNLALCKALKGEHDQARQFLRAAGFREERGHARAVVLFNEALISMLAGNRDEAIAKLKEAIEKSPSDIRHYCQRSVHLDPFRNDPVIYDLIREA